MVKWNNPWRRKKAPPRDTICGYCWQRWATGWDHIRPFSRGGANSDDNLYPACRRCNMILHARLFASLDDKREWIKNELIRRGEWRTADELERARMLGMPREVYSEPEVAAVLQPEVPMVALVTNKPAAKARPERPSKPERPRGVNHRLRKILQFRKRSQVESTAEFRAAYMKFWTRMLNGDDADEREKNLMNCGWWIDGLQPELHCVIEELRKEREARSET